METEQLSDLEFQLRCEQALWRIIGGDLSSEAMEKARALRAAGFRDGRADRYDCAYQKMARIRRRGAEQTCFPTLATERFYEQRPMPASATAMAE